MEKNNSRSNSYTSFIEKSENKRNIKIIIFTIIIGQVLALLIVANGKISEVLEKDKQFITPLLLNSFYYFFLFLIWLLVNRKLELPRLKYLLIIVFDTQSSFLMVYAFSLLPANFVFTVNILSVFWTVILSCIFIRTYKYMKVHIIGLGISVIGVGLTLFGCLNGIDDKSAIFENIKGLLLSLCASIGYSV
jgi:drug/metabolite transporter (DMT)-like permease